MAKLYQFARENRQIGGQTELAKAMGETPQTVNNWEARGISQRGANVAQKRIGCDANWLLGITTSPFTHVFRHAAVERVCEQAQPYGWPFKTITPEEYATLGAEQAQEVEKYIHLQIKARSPPGQSGTPAKTAAPGGG